MPTGTLYEPIRPELLSVGAPTGQIVTIVELATYIGDLNLEAGDQHSLLQDILNTGHDLFDGPRSYSRNSFRARALIARTGPYTTGWISLPGGLPNLTTGFTVSTVGTDGALTGVPVTDYSTDRVGEYSVALCVSDSATYQISYTVGPVTAPPVVKQAIYAISASLWEDPAAMTDTAAMGRLRSLVRPYRIGSDWD